jgi:hypothetical protein
VARAYSHWRLMVRNVWTKLDFADAALSQRELRESSRYAHYLGGWQRAMGTANVLVLLQEDLEADAQAFVDRVCDFIGTARFPVANSAVAGQRVHSVPVAPKSRSLARNARNLTAWLNDRRYHSLANGFRQSALWRFCAERGEPFPPVSAEVDAMLREHFIPEIEQLEKMIGRDLTDWKTPRR